MKGRFGTEEEEEEEDVEKLAFFLIRVVFRYEDEVIKRKLSRCKLFRYVDGEK